MPLAELIANSYDGNLTPHNADPKQRMFTIELTNVKTGNQSIN